MRISRLEAPDVTSLRPRRDPIFKVVRSMHLVFLLPSRARVFVMHSATVLLTTAVFFVVAFRGVIYARTPTDYLVHFVWAISWYVYVAIP